MTRRSLSIPFELAVRMKKIDKEEKEEKEEKKDHPPFQFRIPQLPKGTKLGRHQRAYHPGSEQVLNEKGDGCQEPIVTGNTSGAEILNGITRDRKSHQTKVDERINTNGCACKKSTE